MNVPNYIHTEISKEEFHKVEELMLTSDKLSALDNMSVRVVDGDFKSCNKRGQKEAEINKGNSWY